MTDLSLLSCNSVGFEGPPGFQKHDSFLLGVRLVFPQAAESPLVYTAHEPKQDVPSSPDQASLGKQALASGRQQTLPRSSVSGESTRVRDVNEFQISLCYRQVMSLSHGAWGMA